MYVSKNHPEKKFSSVFKSNRYDEVHAATPKVNDEEAGHEDVVKEHGKAHTVTMKHQGDKHTMQSVHEDGHKHSSEHSTAEEAHDAGKKMACDNSVEDKDQQGAVSDEESLQDLA